MLELKLLGAPIITADGSPAVVDTRKAIALLAYLAVSGQPHRRDALAALLWPDADSSRAAGALRRTLSTVRTAVGAHRLHADRADVGLVMDDVQVDVATARTLLRRVADHEHGSAATCAECIDLLEDVVALHRGTFLEGFALRDSPAFDDWQFFTAEELRRELAAALERLSAGLVDGGRVDDAISHARRRLAIDPLHEPAHRELIRLYAWHGEHAAAVRQYRECVRILDQELGVLPLQETTELYEEVLQQRLEPPAAPAPATPPTAARTLPTATPFVGRVRQLGEVAGAVDGIDTDGRVIVIEGEAGVGKTRLLHEVLESATMAPRRRIVARCYEGETGLAYGVVVEALRDALEHRGDEWVANLPESVAVEAARLLPEVATRRPDLPPPPSLDAPGGRTRFIDALGRVLASAVEGEAPGILAVEDAQWIDEASLEVVTHLARRLSGRAVALVLTWRSELVGRGHALRRLLAEARRDGQPSVVTLERLDADDVAAALGELGVDDEVTWRRVFAETEGLPLLVVEYARALVDDPGALEAPLPGGARDVLTARIDGVSGTAAQVLATAAVIGRSFDLDVLTEASGRSDDEVAAAVEELLARRLVSEVPTGGPPSRGAPAASYDFTHAQLRQLAYDNAALARRRLLHRRVAGALEARARRQGGEALAGVISGHWAAAGDDGTAAHWAARAGAHAAALLAVPQAISHYSTALALGHPDVTDIHERLGDLRTLQGRYAEAVADYESAVATADPAAVAALEHKLGVVHHRSGRWELAEWHLERALAATDGPADAGLRGRVIADRGLNAYRQGDMERAAALAAQAAKEAAAAGDPANQAQAANLLGLLARARAQLEEAREHLERSLSLARDLGDAAAEMSALNNLALAVGAAGQTDEALGLAGAALERSAVVGDRHREAALHNNIADLLRAQGRNEEAMEHLKQAVAIFAEVGEEGVLTPEVFKLVDW